MLSFELLDILMNVAQVIQFWKEQNYATRKLESEILMHSQILWYSMHKNSKHEIRLAKMTKSRKL